MADKKYGLLFPGQGAQAVGMGKELYEGNPAAKRVFDRANEILEKDIIKLCFEGPEEQLQTTANSQPAIFVTSVATLSVLLDSAQGPFDEQRSEVFSLEDVASLGAVTMGLSLGE
ncbi:MAG: acyltransferase domain-containing protein, partial [Candidatus Omnitrophota bacterium]